MNVIDYYTEKWNKKSKPFIYSDHVVKKLGLQSNQSEEKRNTKSQTIEYLTNDGKINYNKRKLAEFPNFIFKLNDIHLKLSYLSDHVYFDYSFVNAKASLEEMDFLKDARDHVWSLYNILVQSNDQSLKTGALELAIMHYIYESDSLLLEKYPHSMSFILSSKLIQLCHNENRFGEFLKQCIKKSIKNCALIMPLSYLPVIDKSKAKTLIYDYKIFHLIVNCHKTDLIFASTENLYVLDTSTQRVIENYDFKDLGEKYFFIRLFCVYFKEEIRNSKSIKIKELNGGFLIRQPKKLYSFSLNKKLLFKKVFTTPIIDLCLLSTSAFIIQLDISKVIQILSVTDGKVLFEKSFSDNIKLFGCNVSKQEVFLPHFEKMDHFVSVLLESGDIHIFHFDKELNKLNLISLIPSSSLQPISIISDGFLHAENRFSESFNDSCEARFACFFKEGNISILSLNFDEKNKTIKKDVSVSLFHFKLNLNSNKYFIKLIDPKKLKVQDFYDNRLLFNIETVCFLYDNSKFEFFFI